MKNCNHGFASISVFVFILFSSVFYIVLVFNQNRVVTLTENLKENLSNREDFLMEIEEIVSVMLDDESRHSFSRYDFIYEFLDDESDNWNTLELTECSSLPNPNFYPLSFWESSSLNSMIIDRAFWDDWEYKRLEEGFRQDRTFWESVLVYDEKNPLFSLYSFINVNTVSLEVLEAYSNLNNLDYERSSVWIEEIRRKRRNKEIIKESDLAIWIGDDRMNLPLLGTHRPININMVPGEILEAALSLSVESGQNQDLRLIKDQIVMKRIGHEIDKDEWSLLISTLSKEKKYQVNRWLGVQSWMWLLTLENEMHCCKVVLGRFYSKESDRYQIVILDIDWSEIL